MNQKLKKERVTKIGWAALIGFVATTFPFMVTAAEYEIMIENHRFVPSQIEVTAGEKHRLIVHNNDASSEEFESYALNREKIIVGHSKAVIFLPLLEPGSYPFFGEFNEDTAQGRIVVK